MNIYYQPEFELVTDPKAGRCLFDQVAYNRAMTAIDEVNAELCELPKLLKKHGFPTSATYLEGVWQRGLSYIGEAIGVALRDWHKRTKSPAARATIEREIREAIDEIPPEVAEVLQAIHAHVADNIQNYCPTMGAEYWSYEDGSISVADSFRGKCKDFFSRTITPDMEKIATAALRIAKELKDLEHSTGYVLFSSLLPNFQDPSRPLVRPSLCEKISKKDSPTEADVFEDLLTRHKNIL